MGSTRRDEERICGSHNGCSLVRLASSKQHCPTLDYTRGRIRILKGMVERWPSHDKLGPLLLPPCVEMKASSDTWTVLLNPKLWGLEALGTKTWNSSNGSRKGWATAMPALENL